MSRLPLHHIFILGLAIASTTANVNTLLAAEALDRTVLPIQAPVLPPITEIDARKAKAPPAIQNQRPKKCAQRGHRIDR